MTSGTELAADASEALGVKLEFENISPYVDTRRVNDPRGLLMISPSHRAEAKRVLHAQSHSDDSEKEYLLEYYSLVREGKTNYISTAAFHYVTGEQPTEPTEFFKMYSDALLPEHPQKKRKTENGK